MRAVTVLLCLALGHDVTANIFQYTNGPPTDMLNILRQHQQKQLEQAFREAHWNIKSEDSDENNKNIWPHSANRNSAGPPQGWFNWNLPGQVVRKTLDNVMNWPNPEGGSWLTKDDSQASNEGTNVYQQRFGNSNQQKGGFYQQNGDSSQQNGGSSQQNGESSQQKGDSRQQSDDSRQQSNESRQQNSSRQQKDDSKQQSNSQEMFNNNDNIDKILNDAFRTTKNIPAEFKDSVHGAFFNAGKIVKTNATQMLKKNNYGVEEFTVKTKDGYFLTMFRIKPKQETVQPQNRPTVLLMHGFLGSADDWLLMGPGKSLAYKMADAGFDVWLGNTRGSKYSRRHASSTPNFWRFSMDEIALQDLPAMIDHVLSAAQQDKLYFVGHSTATTAFFALASTSPQYRQKVAVMYALSPMVFMDNVRSPLLKMISPKSRYFESLRHALGHGEFKPNSNLIKKVGGDMCFKQFGCEHFCSNVDFIMTGVDVRGINPQLIPVIATNLRGGASTRQIKQFGQAIAAKAFRKYDFGSTINQQVYGQPDPPKYNMTDVNVPVVLYHSQNDWMSHPKDVAKLQKELPDVREDFIVPDQHFGQMDFQFSEKAPKVVNDRLIESIQNDFANN